MARLPGGFTKRTDGTFQYRFTVNGIRYSVYGKTVKECRDKELVKRDQIAKGIERRTNPTVSQYSDQWQKNREKFISEATQRTQVKIIRAILPIPIESAGTSFGNMKIAEIRIDDLREVQNKLLEGYRPPEVRQAKNTPDQDRPRRTQTVNDYMAILKHIFKDAKKEQVISFNPAELLDDLKRTEERARDTYHRALTQEEQKLFFQADRTKTSAYYHVFRIAILTGMRCGEIGALQNGDIRNGFISISKTVTRASYGYYISDEAKTEAGRRMIPITEPIREVLKDQRQQNSMLYGNVIDKHDTLFKAPQGGILIATPADREIKTICKSIGIQPFTMHAFRATYATRAIESGINPRTLQELLGHTNFNLTMSLYGHCMNDTKKEEAERIRIVI